MAENQLEKVEVQGRSLGPLMSVYRLAASTIGLDPDDEQTSALIDSKVNALVKANPNAKTGDELASIAKSDVPKLISDFMRPSTGGVNEREQQDLALQREPLAQQVEQRANLQRDFAPFNTNVRDTIQGGKGQMAKDLVDQQYAPLKAFDAQVAARGAARTSDLEATGKQFANQKAQSEAQSGRTKAVGDNIAVFNQQLDNDPNSVVSRAARATASRFAGQLGVDPKTFDGMNKQQVDTHMNSVIKGALANAKTAQERQSLMAAARLADANARQAIAQARNGEVEAAFGESAAADRGLQTGPTGAAPSPGSAPAPARAPNAPTAASSPASTPAPASPAQPGTSPKPLPGALSKWNTPAEQAAQLQQADAAAKFQGSARGRDRLKSAIGDARSLLAQGARTGAFVGRGGLLFNTKVQELAKSLATIMEENGAGAADTNYKAMLSASTGADVMKNVNTIKKILDTVEAQNLKDEFVGQKRIEAQGRPLNESAIRNSLETYKLTEPGTGKVEVHLIDRNEMDGPALKAWLNKNIMNNPVRVGTESR